MPIFIKLYIFNLKDNKLLYEVDFNALSALTIHLSIIARFLKKINIPSFYIMQKHPICTKYYDYVHIQLVHNFFKKNI